MPSFPWKGIRKLNETTFVKHVKVLGCSEWFLSYYSVPALVLHKKAEAKGSA